MASLLDYPYPEANRSIVNAIMASVYVAIAATLYRDFTGSELLFVIGSYHFSIYEPVIAISSFSLMVLSLHQRGGVSFGLLFSVGLFLSFAISVTRGIFISPQDALFTGRIYFTFPLFLLIAYLLPTYPSLVKRIASALTLGGLILAILVLLRSFLGILATEVTQADGRPILAYGATLMAIASILCASDVLRFPRKPWNYVKLAIFLVATIFARQGTAGVGTIVGILIVALFEKTSMVQLRWLSLLLAPGLLLGAIFLAPNMGSRLSQNEDLTTFIKDRQNTNETREQIWSSFSREFDQAPLEDQILGKPMGQKFQIYLTLWGGVLWDNALHSMYYQILSILGYLGLIFYVAILADNLIGSLFRVAPAPDDPALRPVSRTATLACVIFVIVFGRSYDFRGDSAVLLLFGTVAMRALHQRLQRGTDDPDKEKYLASFS